MLRIIQLRRSDGLHCGCALRSSPSSDAPLIQDTCIKRLQTLRVCSWSIENGFLHVQGLEGPRVAGWIRACHLYIEWDGRVYTELSDAAWNAGLWQIETRQCSIRVTQCSNPVPEEECEAMAVNRGQAAQARLCMTENYTYVSLEVGKPFREGREAINNCHITIGYLAPMYECHTLRRRLTEALHAWTELEPQDRPFSEKLMRMRQWEIQTHDQKASDYDVFKYKTIAGKPWLEVQALLDHGLIRSSLPVTPEELPDYVRRLHNRDTTRMEDAVKRVPKVGTKPHSGVLDMSSPMSGLGGNSFELEDLLEYLADAAFYFRESHFRTMSGKLVPPLVTQISRWHCTRQGDWLQTRL